VYVRYHPASSPPDARLWKVHPNGKGERRVSDECRASIGCIIEDDPAWSPNGNRIAFIRGYEEGLHRGSEVMIIRADGTHVRHVTNHPAGRFDDWQVQWAPSGDRLVFQRYCVRRCEHEGWALFSIRPDGTGLRRITPRMDAAFPDWSPDGRWILFTVGEDVGELWMVRANGKRLHEIADTPDVSWSSASFSPDGSMIVAGRTPGVGDAGNADVYVMNVDGSSVVNITETPKWDSLADWGPLRS
jgi:Tol biopolymer transport system component